jgi:hypothetical protein
MPTTMTGAAHQGPAQADAVNENFTEPVTCDIFNHVSFSQFEVGGSRPTFIHHLFIPCFAK